MDDIAGWIAPLATTIAACMTAANLGTRVTGWGFVVFTIGSLAWAGYGALTGQPNLVWQNFALTLINLAGIWRWLGRQARIDDSALAAAKKSGRRIGPTLFPVTLLSNAPLVSASGVEIGRTRDAMVRHSDGGVEYVVVSKGGVGGVGETMHALAWHAVNVQKDHVVASANVDKLPELDPNDWPTPTTRM